VQEEGDTECRGEGGERKELVCLFLNVRTNHEYGAPLQAACLSEAGVEQVAFSFKYCHGVLSTWDKM